MIVMADQDVQITREADAADMVADLDSDHAITVNSRVIGEEVLTVDTVVAAATPVEIVVEEAVAAEVMVSTKVTLGCETILRILIKQETTDIVMEAALEEVAAEVTAAIMEETIATITPVPVPTGGRIKRLVQHFSATKLRI